MSEDMYNCKKIAFYVALRVFIQITAQCDACFDNCAL